MDLKKKIDDFRQLQARRKSEKKLNRTLKMSFSAMVKIEEGLTIFQANITVTSVCIIQRNAENGCRRRNLCFISNDVETYDCDNNTFEINFTSESHKPDTLIMFQDADQRKTFEISFRTFKGYSNIEDVHP